MSFFSKPSIILNSKRDLLIQVLNDYEFKEKEILSFLEAYDYFIKFPNEFDGATIVRDYFLIKDLDVCAMVHDYMYIKFNLPLFLNNKIKADYCYCKLLRRFNISWWSVWAIRFLGLLISTPFFAIYKIIKFNQTRKSNNNKEFSKYINSLLH